MTIIFEDNRKDILCQLLISAYPKAISDEFVFAEGTSRIPGIVADLLQKEDQLIIVYLDMVPGNRDLVGVYRKLKKISIENAYRVVVFPIPCIEYFFIKSISNKKYLFEDITGMDICLSKKYFVNSPLLQTDLDRLFCTSFEKYCKLFLKKNVIDCVKHSKTDNEAYGLYYVADCFCGFQKEYCEKNVLHTKAKELLQEYPYIPDGGWAEGTENVGSEGMWKIHKLLVNQYNNMVDEYISEAGGISEDIGGTKRIYLHIKEIK